MHEHHRDRLRDKAIADIDTLNDVELLELILFHSKPRVNTNDTAHKLINAFGSLDGVFSASAKDLTAVDGVGDKSAAFLVTLSKIMDRVKKLRETTVTTIYSLATFQPVLFELYKGMETEKFIAFYLNAKREIIGRQEVISDFKNRVDLSLNDFAHQIVLNKAKYAVIAHNHPSGIIEPSYDDDKTTEKLFLIFAVNGVQLLDHIIVGDGETYSYFHNHRLDEIKKKIDQIL